MATRVTATLEDLHTEVLESIKDQQGLSSDAAAVRKALATVAELHAHEVPAEPAAVAADLDAVQDLRDDLEAAESDMDRLQSRLEDRDREFRMMSVLVPVALGIDQGQMAQMLPGVDEDELPALPDHSPVQQPQPQRGAIQRFSDWLLGPDIEE
jgi:hypothetical protein